jgi:hypothetical protein
MPNQQPKQDIQGAYSYRYPHESQHHRFRYSENESNPSFQSSHHSAPSNQSFPSPPPVSLDLSSYRISVPQPNRNSSPIRHMDAAYNHYRAADSTYKQDFPGRAHGTPNSYVVATLRSDGSPQGSHRDTQGCSAIKISNLLQGHSSLPDTLRRQSDPTPHLPEPSVQQGTPFQHPSTTPYTSRMSHPDLIQRVQLSSVAQTDQPKAEECRVETSQDQGRAQYARSTTYRSGMATHRTAESVSDRSSDDADDFVRSQEPRHSLDEYVFVITCR